MARTAIGQARAVAGARTLVPPATSVSFDGAASKIQRGTGLPNLTNGFSILTRIRPTNVTGTFVVFGSSTGTNDRSGLSILNGNIRGAYFNGSFVGPASGAVAINTWYTIVYTLNGSTGTLKINDVAQVGTNTPSTSTNNLISVGARVDSTNFFAGLIQGFYVLNRAVTGTEATAYYTNNVVPSNGVILSYRMLEGSGSSVSDTSGSGRTGVGTSITWSSTVQIPSSRFGSETRTVA